MGLPLRSLVAKISCEAATQENAKRRSFMPGTQVTGKANQALRDKSALGHQSREMRGSAEKELFHPEQSVLVCECVFIIRVCRYKFPEFFCGRCNYQSGRRINIREAELALVDLFPGP